MITRENTASFLWTLCVPVAAVIYMLWTGRTLGRGELLSRAESPRAYWIAMAFYILLTLTVTAFGVVFYLAARDAF